MAASLAERARELSGDELRAWIAELSQDEARALLYDWTFWARPAQLPPDGDWVIWLIQAGRGFGKTRTGAEWVRNEVTAGRRGRLALVARTAADTRDVMVEGESGLLAISPPWFRPKYEPSKRRLTWPNGALATLYSADEPDLLRGPQHDGFWADELAAWRFVDAWDQLMFGLRLGQDPRGVVTTTPRPTKLVKALAASPTTRVTRGATKDNAANLAQSFLAKIVEKYQGTRLGRQELDGELLDDNPNALWFLAQIDKDRVVRAPELRRVVVGVDPAVTANEDSDETGIIAAGRDGQDPPHFYVLEDGSGTFSPNQWAKVVVKMYTERQADRVVAEVNNGGDLVEANIRNENSDVSYTAVHATRGKVVRAEPISALYEQGRVHHVGSFPGLEDQMTEYDPLTTTKSPDRMDALVWALTELTEDSTTGILDYYRQQAKALKQKGATA